MIHIVLHQPEIPQNTGNIARTCSCIGAQLHLIEPLGFSLDEKHIKRAGLDYWQHLVLSLYPNLTSLFSQHSIPRERMFLFTTHGRLGPELISDLPSSSDAWLFFGKETKGLPQDFRSNYSERCVRIPMLPNRRSLNLSNAVAIAAYWAWQKSSFYGSMPTEELS